MQQSLAWACKTCCGLCPGGGYAKLQRGSGAAGQKGKHDPDGGVDLDGFPSLHMDLSNQRRKRRKKKKKTTKRPRRTDGDGDGSHQPKYTIDSSDDDELDDELLNELLKAGNDDDEPEKHQEALVLANGVAAALLRGDADSNSFDGKLAKNSLKVLFEPIGNDGLEVLCSAVLRSSLAIETVEFGLNHVAPGPTTELPNFGALLSESKCLRSLSFWGNGVDDATCELIARGLRDNATLRELSVNNNEIGDRGLATIASALRLNQTLERLDVSGNNLIADAGVASLAQALEENKTLTYVNLSSLSVGNAGATKLALLIGRKQPPSALSNVILSSNLIGDNGAMALVLAAQQRPGGGARLRLDIRGNMFTVAAESAVRDCIKARPDVVIEYADDFEEDII